MTSHQLKAIRENMQFTQKELAVRLGLTSNQVARMERGERPIRQVTAMAVMYLKSIPGWGRPLTL